MSESTIAPDQDTILETINKRISALENENRALAEEAETLKIEREEARAKLFESLISNKKYLREVERLKKENALLRRMPLFLATVVEIGEDYVMLRQHGNNQEFITSAPPEIMQKLEPNTRVAINNSLTIVRILERSVDVRAKTMELIEAPSLTYDDVGGLDEQVQEIRETVELPLTKPELFTDIGIEPPRGVLLYGLPGTGKTLLAKAVAHHSMATFIHMSGSELVHKFIGEGAQLVRDIFQMAREKAPSIVFIDEIDAVGSIRTHDGTTGSAEVNRTMMQLLAEMDGFRERGDIKIIAATNRIDILDPALLRPGRFDRIIEIPMPNEEARLKILQIHAKNMKLAGEVSLEEMAGATDGASGAELKAISVEAGMNAIRKGAAQVTKEDFENAICKVLGDEEDRTDESLRMFS
ncbi:MAG: Proteasome-activating nucleotidase 1 [Methanosaeta sp. PtaB.Bin039]|nr:MAG: Proteasome-activating nucleotidase 1 [Methanosaeta sp. PtaB.Bin039]OPY46360.1 MAG: Proteasome-activating nucleotidase 1 [Methanosaeta sp. PtaU1.Bin028]HOT07692.1 proteasome-activating nucleotidase [Methanotrichaceae archaeon]HQF17507.1 proteasome-activating nucleotidase [Methanotrichaceae archaeon]HQI92088.1 proteasome-activating nucleotidase [Methanotrichaceae archaeon]